jgi:signal transduction histidine kinase/DNA-binding response OmpR family regulator
LAKGQSISDSALYYIDKGIFYAKKSNNDSVLASSYYHKANFSFGKRIDKKTIELFKESLKFSDQINNKYYKFRNHSKLGKVYIMSGHEDLGLDHIKKALDITIQMQDSLLIGDAYNNIGDTYKTLDLDTQAKKYFLLALDVYNLSNVDEAEKMITYKNLSRLAETIEETNYYLNKAEKIILKENNPRKTCLFYLTKGDALYRKKYFKEAITAANNSLIIADSINYNLVKDLSLIILGRSNYEINNLNEAEKYLEQAVSLKQENHQNHFITLEALAKTYNKKKEFQKAYQTSLKMKNLMDSISVFKATEKFAEFDAKFKTAEKDKEIAQQQLEIAQQKSNRNKWIFGGIGFLLVGFSIFQWRNNQQKRKKLLAEAKYQNEQEINELRTKFLGNIAHEIRTPLTLISGNLNLALENYDNKDKATQNIKTALSNSKKVVEDANEILELLKFEKNKTTIKLNEVNLTETLKRIYFSFASLAEMKKIKLDFKSTIPENISVKIDVEKVEKILNNLVSNAVKYSPSNATIIFNAVLENNILTVKVTDFGQGIHFNETEKIFQRFYQSSQSNAVGGIGIGLSLAKEFAELLNGNLNVESELKKGSTFIFTLPIKTVNTNIAKQNEEAITKKELKEDKTSIPTDTETLQSDISVSINDTKPNILIVEDNPEMCTYIVEILSDKYNCSTAFDGEEALSKIEKQTFDLITSDIMMPKLDGFQLREKLNKKEHLKNIPFILISAKTLEEDKVKGFQLGIDDYVVKPFNKNELIARIDNLLVNKKSREHWKLQNKDIEPVTDSSDKVLLKKIESEVISNISDESFKIAELASAVGYSQRQLTRILKQYTGMSPVKFILEIRLQKAYKLLQNKSFFTLSEVRYDVGITSSSYFNKKFKERFGINPSELIS